MRSTHLPEMSGGEVEVTGEVIVDHQLRNLQTFVPSFKTNNFVPNEEGKVGWYVLEGSKVVIRVEKTGTNDGVLGDSTMTVSWIALGR